MKKFLTLALALAMVLTLSINVFAVAGTASFGDETGTTERPENTPSVDVKIQTEALAADTVYSIDVAWTSMDFTYTTKGTWNPATHTAGTIKTGSGYGWSNEGKATITLTNHTNATVDVDAAITFEDKTYGVTVGFENNKNAANLNTAVDTTRDNAPSDTIVVTVSGEPSEAINSSTKIATVKLTLR